MLRSEHPQWVASSLIPMGTKCQTFTTSSAIPLLPDARASAMMPDPTTVANNRNEPKASALRRRDSVGFTWVMRWVARL